MKTKVLKPEERGCRLVRKKTKISCVFCFVLFYQSLSPFLYFSKQLQKMALGLLVMVTVVAELEHLKFYLVVNYWGKEDNSLAICKVRGDTQGCLNTMASCHYFTETASNPCLGTALACWKHSEMEWTECVSAGNWRGQTADGPSVQAQE